MQSKWAILQRAATEAGLREHEGLLTERSTRAASALSIAAFAMVYGQSFALVYTHRHTPQMSAVGSVQLHEIPLGKRNTSHLRLPL